MKVNKLRTGISQVEPDHGANPKIDYPIRSKADVQFQETGQGSKEAFIADTEGKEGGQAIEEAWWRYGPDSSTCALSCGRFK